MLLGRWFWATQPQDSAPHRVYVGIVQGVGWGRAFTGANGHCAGLAGNRKVDDVTDAALAYAVSASAVAPAAAPARDRTKREGSSEQRFRETAPAGFKVPTMWEYSAPLIAPEQRETNPSRAQKDPTVVFHGGKWHVFMTVKLPGRSAIEYCSFEKWEDADRSQRTILKVSGSDYYCAPQVFYFSSHKKWYLIYLKEL